jgi:hypothetical protein
MTDINLAYSFNGSDLEDDFNQQQQQQQQQPQQQLQQQPQQIKNSQQQLDINEYHQNKEKEREREIITKPIIPQINQVREKFNNYNYQRNPEYSFWDRMVMSKREVLKLFILSMIIILGISLEKVGYHYLTSYLNSTDLTTFQEFLVRLSFPIIVFLLLWIIKSL